MIYDLIILGGGPAGYLAAERAGHANLKTMVIEKKALGGVCLNEGCIPSKTLLHSAKILDYANHSKKYGVTCSDVSYDHGKVIKRKNKVVKKLVAGVGFQMKRHHVEVIYGIGLIMGKSADGFEVSVGENTYTGTKLLIATGSEAIVPPIPGAAEGFEKGFVLTNKEILDLTEIPENLVIVGGGVIGLEMASYFNSAGSHVSVVEMLDHIAGPTDAEISTILLNNYKKKGVDFHLNCRVTAIGDESVTFSGSEGEVIIKADKVLLSIGRRPVIKGIGLENIGVEADRAINTDQFGRTNITNVYAAGDVNGKSMLAHTAYREAEVCVNHMLGKRDVMRYSAIPSVIYTNPEVASVGETEESALEKGMDVQTVTLPMSYAGRYVAENEGGDGICKVVVDKKYNRLVGVHMIGNPASEIIFGAGLMIESEFKIDDIKELVFPHPTVSEIIREALFEI